LCRGEASFLLRAKSGENPSVKRLRGKKSGRLRKGRRFLVTKKIVATIEKFPKTELFYVGESGSNARKKNPHQLVNQESQFNPRKCAVTSASW